MTENKDPLAGLKAATEHLTKETPEEDAKGILLNAKVLLLDLPPTSLLDALNFLRSKGSVSDEWWEFYKDEIKEDRKKKQPIQSELLLQLAADAEFFHSADHECFARIPVDKHKEVWPIHSRGFRRWLLRKFYISEGRPPQSEALQAVLNLLEAKSYFEGSEHQVWVRVAEHNGNIYLDLGNPAWDAVEITPQGWQVVAEPLVRFRRPKSMKALPYPERGGTVNELRPFLNVGSKADFILAIAWKLAALRPYGPYPIANFNGEQGTAKSTATRIMGALVDPNTSPLRSASRDETSLAIYAENAWALCFDNLSGLPKWLSDAHCRLSTGGGVSNRKLYTDRDENILDAMRPQAMNGIDSLTERSDLADRSLIFNLQQIPDDERKSEEEFWQVFNQAKPRILGALLDAVSTGLKNLESVKLQDLPRMADFAKWVVACEPALPWEEGSFLKAYTGNRAEAVELSLESDVVAVALRGHMAGLEEWEGTPKELHEVLEGFISGTTQKSKAWPKTPSWLSNRIRRAATFLRKVGINVEFSKSGDRKITIKRVPLKSKQNSAHSAHSAQAQEPEGFEPDANEKNGVQMDENSVQTQGSSFGLDANGAQMDAKEKIASTGKTSNHADMGEKDAKDANLHTLNRDNSNDEDPLTEVFV
jgi:hypothetical protein